MAVKLLAEYSLEFLSFKGAAQVLLSQHLSKCLIVGNHMSRLMYKFDAVDVDISHTDTEMNVICAL